MRRRTYTTITSLVVVALLVGWLPNSDWLRARIAAALSDAAADVGVVVAFERVEGYAWRGLTLVTPSLAAPGANLAADRVRVDWFLPSLLVGELPLRLDVRGLRGDIEVARLSLPAASTTAPPALRVRLDAVRVDGADLRVAEVPYTLPDVRIELLEATSLDDGAWSLETTLATADGRLRGTVLGRLGDPGLEIALHEADARVARHWWGGAEAGTIEGTLTWGPAGADGVFELSGGSVRYAGATATDLTGPVVWRGDLIEAAWTGRALGGRVDVAGIVDVAASRWSADAEVDVAFPDASGALWAWLGAPAVPAAEAGVVRGRVEAFGWTGATIAAALEVDGRWLGAPLALPDLRVGFDPVVGLSVSGEGRWGEGPLRLATRPGDGQLLWEAEAGPVRVLGVPVDGIVAAWTTGGGPPTVRAELRGGEGPWSAAADLVLDAEGIQAFVVGTLFDAPFEGALAAPTAALDAPLEGGVVWTPPAAWLRGSPRVEARFAGSFGAPLATVELGGEGPVAPRSDADAPRSDADAPRSDADASRSDADAPVAGDPEAASGALAAAGVAGWIAAVGAFTEPFLAGFDLRGAVEAGWAPAGAAGGAPAGAWVEGRLGPVVLRGDAAGWSFELDALPLAGPLVGRVGPGRGAWREGGWSATLATEVATAAGPTVDGPAWLATPELAWTLSGDAQGAMAEDATGGWRVSFGGALGATLTDVEIAVLGRPARLDGRWDDGVGEARLDFEGAAAFGRWADGGATGRVEVGGQAVDLTWTDGALTADGAVDLAAAGSLLAPTLGAALVDVAGTARVDASWRVGVDALPVGSASVALTAPWPVAVDLAGDGRQLRWDGGADAPAAPLRSVGTWAPGQIEGDVAWGAYGTLRIGPQGAEGAGTWAGGRWGAVVVEPQPWSVEIDPAGRARAVLGGSSASFDPATLRVDALVDLEARWGDTAGRVQGRAAWSATPEGGAPDGRVDLAVDLGGDASAVATGDLGGVTLRVAGSAARWAAVATPLLGPTGAAALAGEVEGALTWRPDAGLAGDVRWTDRGGGAVRLVLAGGAVEADGVGWSARLEEGSQLTVAARDARVDLLVRRDDAALRLDGDLRLDLASGGGEGALRFGMAALGATVDGVLAFVESGALMAEAEIAAAGLVGRADGPVTLRPALGWSGAWSWDGLDALASAGAGTFELGAAGVRVDGALTAAAGSVGPLSWPAVGLDVGLDPDGSWRAVGTDGLTGRWPEGLRVDVELLGAPHTASLRPLADGWRADLTGESVNAAWSGDPAAWTLAADGVLAGVALGLEATGAGTEARGTWWAGAVRSDAWATGPLAFDGAVLDGALDGADLDLAAWLGLDAAAVGPVAGALLGRVDVDGWSLEGALEGNWRVGGVVGAAGVEVRGSTVEVDVDADLLGVATEWRVVGDLAALPAGAWAIEALVADVGARGLLTTGGADGIAFALASDDGAWSVEGAGLDAGRATVRGPAALDLTATWVVAPSLAATLTGGVAGVEIGARLDAAVDGVPRLEVEAAGADGIWAASLAGPIAPLALRGELALGGTAAPLALDDAPTWRLAWGDLVATTARGGVELRGRTAPGQLPLVELSADPLGWSPSAGWWGEGRAVAAPGFDVAAVAALVGDGDLTADLALSWEGRPAGGVTLRLPADPTLGLTGEAELQVSLPIPEGGPWTLAARGPLSAGPDGWGAELALDLAGATPARGSLSIADGALAGRLEGDGLHADGRWAAGAGEGRIRLEELDLADALPWLDRPLLSAEARIDIDGSALTWWVDGLRLALPGGAVEGGGVAHPDGRVQATLSVDVDLADVRWAGPWSGRIGGPVTFEGRLDAPLDGAIAARLEAREVAWSGFGAALQGDVAVSGRAGDPLLQATWVARGADADLDGEATWRPQAGQATVRAQGSAVGVGVDVDFGWGPDGFAGGGRVDVAGTSWTFAGAEGLLDVRGLDVWSGWRATLDPTTWQARVAGDLAALPYARGAFEGTVDLAAAGRPVVALDGRELEVAGLALGDGRVEGDAVSGWRLVGERVEASLSPDGARWAVALREVPTPIGTTLLTLAARSDSAGIAVEGAWWGATPLGPVDVDLALDDLDGSWRGSLSGGALGGRLTWPVAWADDGWVGSGNLVGASLFGRALAADLELSGALTTPEVAVGWVAGDEGAWRADLRWFQGAALVGIAAPLPAGGAVTLRGRVWPDVDLVADAGADGRVRVTAGWRDRPLRLDGDLELPLGPARLVVQGPATLRLQVPALAGGVRATVPARPIVGAIEEIRRDGWRWIGDGAWTGELLVARAGAPWLEVRDLVVAGDDVTATIAGHVDGVGAELTLTADLGPLAEALAGAGGWPWRAPLRARVTWVDGVVEATSEAPWASAWRVDPVAGSARVAVDVAGPAEGDAAPPFVRGDLQLDALGWSGELQVATVTEALGADPAALEARVVGVGDHLALSASLRGPRGSATATGRWDAAVLRPAGWGPAVAPLREFDARVVGLDLAGFAGARALAGSLTGSASLRGDALFGRITTEGLTLGHRTAPAVLDFQGDLGDPAGPSVSGRLDLGGAVADLQVDAVGVGAYVRFERFPLHELVAAAIGSSDVVAEVTGALRGSWAWGARAPNDLRVASEQIRLERAGVETRGQLAFAWDGAALTIGEANFEGRGAWQVRGSATPELLDLELLAQDADFGPLLGLVPSFARFGVTAQGDLVLSARGTPAAPDVLVRTDDLELGVAGTRYRLEDVRLTLQGEAWTGRAEIAALDPLQGRLTLVSEGRVGPFPDRSFSLAARAVGGLDVPFVGRVEDLVADLIWSDQGVPTLEAVGRLGEPFTVAGPLAPLDLRGRGSNLRLAIPFLFVADATLDADLRLVGEAGGVTLSGRVDATQARVDLGARGGGVDEAGDEAAEATIPQEIDAGAAVAAAPSEARQRFRFDGVRIVAPQRVTFAESFGNAEAAVDLTLDGTLAGPRLSGAVRALRGTVRFGGRELELIEAVATFDPTRGVLPGLRIAARTGFDKARVVAPGSSIRFLAPSGPIFGVELRLEGEATVGDAGFTLDLQPLLSSDAIVDGVDAGGARPLTELELLTLVTLGRLEGASGVAGAFAQSALDTAVELLVTAELQAILAEALGVDVVELRTTAVSTLIDGTDPFGVSLRLGGYVSEEVFASYRVSTLGGATFSNEVAFAYQLGPVAVDITGRIDVAAGAAATTPSLAVGARYGFAPGWALELGVDLSTERSTARLGVTWRW